uniref:PROP1-like PPR domain-containing protein n=1 Tax=Aplanochytrium stocchinoi TaxID=215587 RepID=A0A7S3PGR6_9STRA
MLTSVGVCVRVRMHMRVCQMFIPVIRQRLSPLKIYANVNVSNLCTANFHSSENGKTNNSSESRCNITQKQTGASCMEPVQNSRARQYLKYNKIYQRRRPTMKERRLVGEYRERIVEYRNKEKYGKALRKFNEMEEVGVTPDIQTYTAVLSILNRLKQPSYALRLFHDMIKQGIQPDIRVYCSIIGTLVKSHQWEKALEVFDNLIAAGMPAPNVFVYNAAIRACGVGKQWERAVQLFEDMNAGRVKTPCEIQVKPDIDSYSAIINACRQCGKWEKALEYFEMVDKNWKEIINSTQSPKQAASVRIYNSALLACSDVGKWERALELFDEMKKKGTEPNSYTYSSAISACILEGKWEQALSLSEDQYKQRINPTIYTFSALISTCEKGKQWDKCIEIHEDMVAAGFSPISVTDGAKVSLIIAYGKAGDMKNAFRMFDLISAKNEVTYSAIISACETNALWEKVLQLHESMNRSGIELDDASKKAVASAHKNMSINTLNLEKAGT